jgi:hypothetical protein
VAPTNTVQTAEDNRREWAGAPPCRAGRTEQQERHPRRHGQKEYIHWVKNRSRSSQFQCQDPRTEVAGRFSGGLRLEPGSFDPAVRPSAWSECSACDTARALYRHRDRAGVRTATRKCVRILVVIRCSSADGANAQGRSRRAGTRRVGAASCTAGILRSGRIVFRPEKILAIVIASVRREQAASGLAATCHQKTEDHER